MVVTSQSVLVCEPMDAVPDRNAASHTKVWLHLFSGSKVLNSFGVALEPTRPRRSSKEVGEQEA
jgi:hypothetical protein